MYTKILYLKEKTNEPIGKLFFNLSIKAVIGALSYFVVLLFATLFIAKEHPWVFLIIISYISFNVALYLFFVKKERGEKTFNVLIKYLIPRRLKKTLTKFTKTFYNDFPKIKDLFLPFVISFLFILFGYIHIYIIALSIGIEVPFYIIIVFFAVAGIVTMIPIPIGNLGIKTAILLPLFSLYGVEAHQIVALSLINYVLSVLIPVFYGFVFAVIDMRSEKQGFTLRASSLKLKKLGMIKNILLSSTSKK
jgi:uncharacterized protein (TIRG00374 family)